jgi:mono/diheme cytochrome c family protein
MPRLTLLALALAACSVPRVAADPAPPAGAQLFARLGCSDCHAVTALGVRAMHDVAPDLTFAYADVVDRYGVNLESFLANPSGVMRLMLGAHIDLTVADRDSIVTILKGLHDRQRADAARTGPATGAGRQ